MRDAVQRITPTGGDDFRATVDGRTYDKRADAVAGLSEWVRAHTPEYANYTHQPRNGEIFGLGANASQTDS